MKKFFTLFVVLLVQTLVFGQNRLVLVEEFTNTGCGPCASWSPILDSAIHYRLGDCIAIKYHSHFPNRNDEFFNYQPDAHQARVDFYSVSAVPTTLINGQELGERSFAMMNTAISYCQQQPALFEMNVSKQLNDHQLSVSVAGAKAAGGYSEMTEEPDLSQLRLFVAVIEEHIVSATPYPNGERELNYTMRKMLTPADGQVLNASTFDYSAEWDIDFFDDLDELGVVAFVQNVDTKEVVATAYSGPKAEGENQLALQNLYDTPDMLCVPIYYGKVIFRNDGANVITSAMLNVKINGTVKQYPWTGELNYLQRDTLEFDDFTEYQLATQGKNQGEVWFSDINGSEAVSNARTFSFDNSVQATYDVMLKIYTDKKPEETTWKLFNSAGEVVREGGPYTEARKFVTVDFELTRDDCYLLEFYDAGGDGIKGSSGNGYYQLFQLNEAGKTTRITQGDYDGAVHDVYFNLTGTPQQPRLVLFEEFTNTSCDPCSEFSPYLDQLIDDRMGDMVAITYHWNIPSPQDPFYLADPEEVDTRAEFYGISGVPSMFVLGQHVKAYGYEEYLNAYVDGAQQTEATMDIEAEASLDNGLLKVDVSFVSQGNDANLAPHSSLLAPRKDSDHDLRLFVVPVEERVEWDTPAANGERSWNYVMRKMLPNADGQQLDNDLTQVTPYHYSFSWNVENYEDETELGIVSFVQDMTTKEVLCVSYTPRPTGSASAAKILRVENTPDYICQPQFSADLVIRNTGKQTLTSADINVSINGTTQTTAWTGSLDYLEIATLQSPLFEDFTLSDDKTNEVEIWLSHLNGTDEETPHTTLTLTNAYKAQHAVRLTIMTDNMPEEITWQLLNSAGDVVDDGGPYTEARKKQVHDLAIDSDDCYTLVFYDAGDNGITGENGRGYYMLHEVNAEGKTRLLVQADYKGASHEVHFSVTEASFSGIESIREEGSGMASAAEERLYDMQGRPVREQGRGVVIVQGVEQTKKLVVK